MPPTPPLDAPDHGHGRVACSGENLWKISVLQLQSVVGLGSGCWRNDRWIQRNHLKKKNQSLPFHYSRIYVLILFVAAVLPNHINSFTGKIVIGVRSSL